MTSIEKDLREVIKTLRADKQEMGILQAVDGVIRGYSKEADKLESLIPRIVAAVEQAQAEAIQSAAEHFPVGEGTWVSYCECGWKPKQPKGGNEDMTQGQWRQHILALTPRRVQIEAELRITQARMDITDDCNHSSLCTRHDGNVRIDICDTCKQKWILTGAIANLERELEAERKGVQK